MNSRQPGKRPVGSLRLRATNQHEHNAGQHARDNACEEQVADRDPDTRSGGVDDHVVGRGNQQADDGGGDGDVHRVVAGIALFFHQRDHRRTDRRSTCDRRTRNGAEHHRSTDIHDAKAASDTADCCIGDPYKPFGDARTIHEIAGEDEERDCHEGKDADARSHSLHRNDRWYVHRQEAGERCGQQRKGDRHPEDEQEEEHAEKDQQFHYSTPASRASSPG